MEQENLFEEFIGKEIKAPYKDGTQFKVARGTLRGIEENFIKITGELGTLIINKKNIEKISRVEKDKVET